jgi:Calcineurin-like phosphoesterase
MSSGGRHQGPGRALATRKGLPASLGAASCALILAALLPAAAAGKSELSVPWPPAEGPGALFAHFGEEHINDADGGTLLPKVVSETIRYRPSLVTMSGDKVDKGEVEELRLWADVMGAYDAARVPWFAAVGNHDRLPPPGSPGGVLTAQDFSTYSTFFGSRPYPMGDGAPYPDPAFGPRQRPGGDPEGAASNYYVDYGPVRWIFIDNSCWSITLCDLPGIKEDSGQQLAAEGQLAFMSRIATEAQQQGRLAFVVMHMPTQDPRDQSYVEPTSVMHTMGKGPAGTADNAGFEAAAAGAGIDGVFVAHIKGQFRYTGQGGVPYFIDGGAGGELYTTGPVGVDHGYWHGYRLIRVTDGGFSTDTVPIFVPGSVRIEGPPTMARGQVAQFTAFGRQPVFNDPAKVEALELRDPAPTPRTGLLSAGVGSLALIGGVPLLLLVLVGLQLHASSAVVRRALALSVGVLGTGALAGGISVAQQSEPTSTPKGSLPSPARIWTSSDPLMLQPVASSDDDPRRNATSQTKDGSFRATCPGKPRLEIASGWESVQTQIHVPSEPGRLIRRFKPKKHTVKVGKETKLAKLRLAQPAVVEAFVKRKGAKGAKRSAKRKGKKGRRVATLLHACVTDTGSRLVLRWNGRASRELAAGNGNQGKPKGRHKLIVKIHSDRPIKKRVSRLAVRGGGKRRR